ncbi:hypothetical protein B0H10DRAFT_1946756 [Mycena sp. CBHHK59/15]|nr:hypothetical protein B0H10DRAFT_1946756 [Mycena sp. CBHHK59/15]
MHSTKVHPPANRVPTKKSTPVLDSDVIDLTESPEASRPRGGRMHSRALTPEIIDLSELPPTNVRTSSKPPPPFSASDAIDLSHILDSPVVIEAPQLPETPVTEVLPPHLPAAPAEIQTVDKNIDPPLMDVDPPGDPSMDIDHEPVSVLLQKMTVSEEPVPPRPLQGGTLAPTWIRERFAVSGELAKWQRLVAAQNRPKPLSRRKPETTKHRIHAGDREPFVVLPLTPSKRMANESSSHAVVVL